jgi:methanol--5-hydroxybenzimidazolylcobamide Co-methyltransferase
VADILSIVSTGGKKLHDDTLLNRDRAGSVFALGVLACRHMVQLWDMIVAVAAKRHVLAAGDSACGFGNTAMALADTHHIPKVWVQLRVSAFPH